MNLKFKIVSVSPGSQSHLENIEVEILKPTGSRFPTPKTFTVEVTDNATLDEIRNVVRKEMAGRVKASHMTGDLFDL